MISARVNLCKKQFKSSRAACTGNATLDFLPSLIHDTVSIFRKVTAENENLPGPQLVYGGHCGFGENETDSKLSQKLKITPEMSFPCPKTI